jgi:hypothetical protein
MIITLSLILVGSIICSLKFFLETESVLSGKKTVRQERKQSNPESTGISSKDGGSLVVMLFILWILSVVLLGMGMFTLPLLLGSLIVTPSIISILIKRYVINDQVICFGASLMAIGIILSLFML